MSSTYEGAKEEIQRYLFAAIKQLDNARETALVFMSDRELALVLQTLRDSVENMRLHIKDSR